MRGLVVAAWLFASIVVLGCSARPAPGPVVSPTGTVYEPGTPPAETRRSQTATLYLRQDRVDRALELALEGVDADTANPIHYFLAGVAYVRLDRFTEADAMFAEAQRIYPAYELDIEPEREAAWASAFNAGLEAYAQGEVERTLQVWHEATVISDLRPEAHRNLASVLAIQGRYEEAVDIYREGLDGLETQPATRFFSDSEVEERAQAEREMEGELARLLLLTDRFAEAEPLFRRQLERDPTSVQLRGDLAAALTGLGRSGEARQIYTTLLSEDGLAATQLFNLGVALFRAEDFPNAADAFERLTELQPESRDAWFNYANSLFAAESWEALATVGGRLVELDPLNENAHLITARAQVERGDRDAAMKLLEIADAAPVYVSGLQLRRRGSSTSVQGQLTGNTAETGSAVRLRFTFYGAGGGALGTETVAVVVPAEGDTTGFEVTLPQVASAYRYERSR